MSLDEKFIPIRNTFYDIIASFFQTIARVFGYPNNPGMPTMPDISNEVYSKSKLLDSLPRHKTFWPPIQRPETWFEVIFGPTPKVDTVPKYIYESQDEGFYNFYIENYKNIYFLPDWLSQFIQVKLNICLDLTVLETIREVLFVGLVVYSQIIIFRIALSWFLYINPYTFPWCYLAAAVDWTEEILQGVVPAILGVNVTGSVFLGLLGVMADGLNHLVFTMPFLPSEGEETKMLINQEMRDVLKFHYLPILWYRYPIPNEIREFWYYDRPDILKYMQNAYKDLDIQFLPDSVVKQLNEQIISTNLISESISTEILSTTNLVQIHSKSNSLDLITDAFNYFLTNTIN
jgi:hypothetical protein|uniref:Ycf89 n=1 Tax=Fistulifera solaris TaxID=1519565 RepID=F3Y7B7_FISSO|nr:hypothetical protein FispC_p031 [Fistulifera solaris]BAK18962.1 conserved hypothetical protein [Fistulifera solaris]